MCCHTHTLIVGKKISGNKTRKWKIIKQKFLFHNVYSFTFGMDSLCVCVCIGWENLKAIKSGWRNEKQRERKWAKKITEFYFLPRKKELKQKSVEQIRIFRGVFMHLYGVYDSMENEWLMLMLIPFRSYSRRIHSLLHTI